MRARGILTQRTDGAGGGINATPLIDVVMCLIVFYLIVGRLASEKLSEVDLPATAIGDSVHPPELLVVNVVPADPGQESIVPGADSRMIVEGLAVADSAALSRLVQSRLAAKPETVVQVRASRRLTFGQVEPALRACAGAGATNIRLVTEKGGAG